MKLKNWLAILVTALTISTSFAQSENTKDLIANKWIIDQEAMKPVLQKMLEENPQTSALDELNKQVALSTALNQISTIKIEYKKDGSLASVNPNGNSVGVWSLSSDGRELTTKTEGKPEKKFTIIEISKLKLQLLTADKKSLFFKSE